MLFKVKDYNGVYVILSKDTWYKKLQDPIFGHPEVKPLLPQIKSTVKEPDFAYQSIRDIRSRLLVTKIARGAYASYYLVIVVKYVKEKGNYIGYVSTVMINRKLPRRSKLIWERKTSI